MKKNKQNNSVMNKANSNITNSNKASNNITNANGQNIGFDTNKTSASKSFKYDENADHSFELRDCK